MSFRKGSVALAAAITLAVVAIGLVNAVDYFRFHRAVARLTGLTETERLALADYCRTISGNYRFTGDKAPTAFQPLHPLGGTLFPGSCDANLYTLGEVYLTACIFTSPSNQQIIYFTNSSGPQETKVLWNRNPEFIRRVSPLGRLVTVTQWAMHGARRWVVRPENIFVIDSPGAVGTEDRIIATIPLDDASRSEIVAAMNSIEPLWRGMAYRTSGSDGIGLSVGFNPSGEPGPDDIRLSNTWIDVLHPLLNAISRNCPKEYQIDFEEKISAHEYSTPSVHSLRLADPLEPKPRVPWWCIWRSIVR